MSTSESSQQQYLTGIQLFNAGSFWHAHEHWEACWLHTSAPDSTFYKGIIQAAAALVHWQRGNSRGLWRNWQKSRPKLVALPPIMHGIDLRALIAAMDGFVLGDQLEALPQIIYNETILQRNDSALE